MVTLPSSAPNAGDLRKTAGFRPFIAGAACTAVARMTLL
jgi:hypothetical protein